MSSSWKHHSNVHVLDVKGLCDELQFWGMPGNGVGDSVAIKAGCRSWNTDSAHLTYGGGQTRIMHD